jgi:hypothetical protein
MESSVTDNGRLLYGLSFPMSEEAQKDDFVIPVSYPATLPTTYRH